MKSFSLKSWMGLDSDQGEDDRKFVRVGRVDDVAPGAGKVVVVMGRDVGLFNCGGTFRAVENVCPHNNRPITVLF